MQFPLLYFGTDNKKLEKCGYLSKHNDFFKFRDIHIRTKT